MSENTQSRTLVIGDVHGCLDALIAMESYVNFQPEDEIIFLGDYIDRGPDSKQVIDWIIEKQQTLNIKTLVGNHEVMMVNAADSFDSYIFWVMNGGTTTLESFDKTLIEFDQKYWDFIDRCQLFIETDDYIYVHGGATPEIPISEQNVDTLCWLRFREHGPHHSGKTIICGHTPQRNYIPSVKDGGVCIDTHVFNPEGFLTCLDTNSGKYWQTSNHSSEQRSDTITMPCKEKETLSV